MSDKIVVQCQQYMKDCVVIPWQDPPSTSYYQEHGFSGTTIFWFDVIGAILFLALIVGCCIVRYKRHEERGMTDRKRLEQKPILCDTCGSPYEY